MSNRRVLLTLLVHRRTREKYYREHDLHVAKQKLWLEEILKQPFDAMPHDRQTHYLDRWFWPPWRFSDIVGFAEIELETPTELIGHLYLPEGRATKATKKPLFLRYACASSRFEENDLDSLRTAILEVAQQLKSIVTERRWVLEIKQEIINHTDFLSIIKDMDRINEK
jgi:hypothetical protein